MSSISVWMAPTAVDMSGSFANKSLKKSIHLVDDAILKAINGTERQNNKLTIHKELADY
jgi:hypothetical protein